MPSPEVVGGKRSVHVDTPAAGRDPTPGGAPCKRQRSVGRLDPAAGQQEAVAGQHGGVAGQHGSLAELQDVLAELVRRQVCPSSEAERIQSDLTWTNEADILAMIRDDYTVDDLQKLYRDVTGGKAGLKWKSQTIRARIVRYIIVTRGHIEQHFRDIIDRRPTPSYEECGFCIVGRIMDIRDTLERGIRDSDSDSGESEQEQESEQEGEVTVQQEGESEEQESAVQQEQESEQQESAVQQEQEAAVQQQAPAAVQDACLRGYHTGLWRYMGVQ
jgi:hypothetical protein